MASKEILEEIRARSSIVSLIGERIPLKKSGRNFKGLCPFHQEKSPSFMVSDDKQIFHCFGCGAGGDIFTFVMKIDGLDFPEALKDLARRAGVTLPKESQSQSPDADAEWERRKQWSLKLNQLALEHFIKNLEDPQAGKKAGLYLEKRGIEKTTAKIHKLGAAKEGWDALTHAFAALKAPMKLAVELGLIREKENGGYYDFFRDRLMFPIFDSKGAVVGFSGRTLNAEDAAKYINSSDSILYHKSKTLFGFFWAKEAIRKQDEVILVEGNLDCLTLRQAGIENVAAPLGTALTAEHLKFLSRHTQNFIIAFDGDKAGSLAAIRALPLFLELKLVPKALRLPQGSDPDSFIRTSGIKEWEALKNRSKTLFEYFLDETMANTPKGTQGVVQAWEKIAPILNRVESPVEKGIYKRQIAVKLGVEEKWLEEKKRRTMDRGPWTEDQKQNVKEYPKEERLLIAAMVLKPKLIDIVKDSGPAFTHPELQQMATQLFEAHAEEKSASLAALQTILNEPLAQWVREMALVEEEEMVWEKAVEDCLAKIRIKSIGARLEKLNREIAEAENRGNEAALLDLLNEKTKLMESKKRSTL